jgi:hypothetical protein
MVRPHGFYWTASEGDPAGAWFYNFGQGGLSLNRHSDGERQRAFPFGERRAAAVCSCSNDEPMHDEWGDILPGTCTSMMPCCSATFRSVSGAILFHPCLQGSAGSRGQVGEQPVNR